MKKLSRRPLSAGFCLCALLALATSARADTAKIAIASNFTSAAREIAVRFERDTGHKIVLVFGSTGKLFAQIAHSAPYDAYLAADQARPLKAEQDGLAIAGSRFTYAIGRLVIYSPDPDLIPAPANNDAKRIAQGPFPPVTTLFGWTIKGFGGYSKIPGRPFNRLAVANPRTAPYGRAALEFLQNARVYKLVSHKLVYGENISQAFQFVASRNAELGLLARAQTIMIEGGSRWPVPQHWHNPIRQDAILLQRGKNNKAARAFLRYLKGQKARAIIKKFGYDVP